MTNRFVKRIFKSSNPELQFRYCSKCAGYHCFCSDHIFNHVHFTDENP